MTLEIQVLPWDMRKNVAGYVWFVLSWYMKECIERYSLLIKQWIENIESDTVAESITGNQMY